MIDTSRAVRRLTDWDHDQLHGLAGEFDTPLYVLDPERVLALGERATVRPSGGSPTARFRAGPVPPIGGARRV